MQSEVHLVQDDQHGERDQHNYVGLGECVEDTVRDGLPQLRVVQRDLVGNR